MPGKVIGTALMYGFPGNPSRMQDCVIAPYKYAKTNTGNIAFGEPVAYDATNKGVRKVGSSDTADVIIGIAVRKIGQPYADNAEGWYYAPGDVVDVMLRGSISVPVAVTTGIAARGQVYVCKGTGTQAAGDVVCQSAADTLAPNNMKFATGDINATDKVAEVTIVERTI